MRTLLQVGGGYPFVGTHRPLTLISTLARSNGSGNVFFFVSSEPEQGPDSC